MLFIFKELVPLVEFCLVFLVLGTIFVLICENGLFWYALACVPFIVIILQLKTNKCNKLTANQKKSNIRNNSVKFFLDNKHRTYYYDKENTQIYLNKGKTICTTTIYRQFITDEGNIEQSAIFIMDLTSRLYLVKKDYPCALPYKGGNNHHFKWQYPENNACMSALFQTINNDFKTKINPKINQPIKPAHVYSETEICRMNWRSFEEFITNLFETNGYDAKTTPPTNDEGKDIIAVKDGVTYFIECKRWKRKSYIGRELLQKLVGAAIPYSVKNIIFITTGKYNDNAIQYATELNSINSIQLQLWNMQDILNMANNVENSIRTPYPIDKRDDLKTTINREEFYSFGAPSTKCSIDILNNQISITDYNPYCKVLIHDFSILSNLGIIRGKLFFEEIRASDRPDLIYFHTDGTKKYLNYFKIIGCYKGYIKELFSIEYSHEKIVNHIGANCRIYINRKCGTTSILLCGCNGNISVSWNGTNYIWSLVDEFQEQTVGLPVV